MSEVKVERRMNAYYYHFEPTGVDAVDVLLSAVACAGKAFHYTSDWGDDSDTYNPEHRGANPVEWIQNAANDAAEEMQQTADSSEAIAAARAEGYAKCQADVVAWHKTAESKARDEAERCSTAGAKAIWLTEADYNHGSACAIESGSHIGASDSVPTGRGKEG